MANENNIITLIPLKGMRHAAEEIKKYVLSLNEKFDVEIIEVNIPRFATGDAKAVLQESVRGKDVYILVDVGNHNVTYTIQGDTNHMSPDDHFQDLVRTISAVGGKANRINVISPLLYSARQDRRSLRESLDCAVALQNLYKIGVENIMAFDVHDDRVQNATPFMGFDKLMPTYQIIKAIHKNFPDVEFDEDHLVMVSPDFGGMGRNYTFSNELKVDLGIFYKRRSNTSFKNGKYEVEAHKYIGPDVSGKDVLIVDDIIASGETMLDVVSQVKKMKAKRIFLASTFGFFTSGTEKFDAEYDSGDLAAVFVTNASYISDAVKEKPWFYEVNIIKYMSYYIYSLHSGKSVAKVIDPHKKIQSLIHHIEDKPTKA